MDCSTFAFDLHVLGTPPALILSQDQTLKLNASSASHRLRGASAKQLFNAERLLIDGSLTLFSSSSYVGGSQPAASGELHPRPAVVPGNSRRPEPPRHPLILDGFSDFAPPALRRDRLDSAPTTLVGNCACTFYLVFKEPAFSRSTDCGLNRRLGNLTRLQKTADRVKNFFAGPVLLLPVTFVEPEEGNREAHS